MKSDFQKRMKFEAIKQMGRIMDCWEANYRRHLSHLFVKIENRKRRNRNRLDW